MTAHFAPPSTAEAKVSATDVALGRAAVAADSTGAQPARADLAFLLVATFRAHPHINNVLTHISRSNWGEIERALNAVLDPTTTRSILSPLAQNMADLMGAESGTTGKILKPHLHAILNWRLGPSGAEGVIRHIETLLA
jgi:hypothetical protein